MRHFLQFLKRDVIEERTGAFIKKQGEEVLIQCFPARRAWRIGIVRYVAYVDMAEEKPRIQYRLSAWTLLFLMMLLFTIVWVSFMSSAHFREPGTFLGAIAFIAAGLLVGFLISLYEREKILEFITKKMCEKQE